MKYRSAISLVLENPSNPDMFFKLFLISLLVNLAFSKGKYGKDPCDLEVDDSICDEGGVLKAMFVDADAEGCSPYSPFITRKRYRCNNVSYILAF